LHDNKVDFLSIGHPAAIKIRGEGSKMQGQLTVADHAVSGKLTFDLDSLDTNIDLRNKHMKEKYLETSKFKNAELEIEKLNIPDKILNADASDVQVPFTGVLTLHGVKQAVQGTSEIRLDKTKLSGKAEFEIKLSDFKIEIPTYLGVTVADVVKVSVALAADGKESQ